MNGAESDPVYRAYVAAFVQTLQQLGWREGQNFRIDLRWPTADPERIGADAAELVGMTPDVILCSGSASLAALRTTRSISVVFVLVSDPVAQGFVTNLAHPGGKITGFSAFEPSMAGKWLDLLKQASSGLVAVIFNPDTSPQSKLFVPAIEASASSLAVEVLAAPVHVTSDFEPLIASFSRRPNSGLIFPSDQSTSAHTDLILELVARYRLPAVYAVEAFARNGGLIYYGFDEGSQFRQAAIYVDRILKGVNPGDLPVQQPTKFSLIVNLSAARALGIELPIGLLLIADEVIE
jgi:putative ABC transport system substrate-binding protein